jgi:hypothetical protein
MKLEDLNVLIKINIQDKTFKVVYMGKYAKCVQLKFPDDDTEVILKVGQVLNLEMYLGE